MKNTYPITPEQEALLNSFTCERLTANKDNLSMIQTFLSYRGPGLVHNLRTFGWSADQCGSTAYYVIKNAQGRIVMFFSLKCGMLFDPDYVQRCADEYSETQQLWRAMNRARIGDQDAKDFLLEKEREMGREAFSKCMRDLYSRYHDASDRMYSIKSDKRDEPNAKIIRVDLAHAAVELVEFCANDRTKNCWNDLFRSSPETRHHTMGKVFFWWFIVPKMIEVSRIVGCEYAYLFAADDDPNGDLVRYYEDALHFRKLTHLGTIKPYYDMNCYFMGRRLFSVDEEHTDPYEVIRDEDDLRGLDYYREEFFANFNLYTNVDDMI